VHAQDIWVNNIHWYTKCQESGILAKWLAGVTVGLACQHPDNVHMQPGPGFGEWLNLFMRFFSQKVSNSSFLFEAAGCYFHQRLCDERCGQFTTGATLNTWELWETWDCKLPFPFSLELCPGCCFVLMALVFKICFMFAVCQPRAGGRGYLPGETFMEIETKVSQVSWHIFQESKMCSNPTMLLNHMFLVQPRLDHLVLDSSKRIGPLWASTYCDEDMVPKH
jgi:hypothetical protein